MQAKLETSKTIDTLQFLPLFADYLLTHRLKDFVTHQIQLSRQVDVPLLRAFSNFTDDDIIQLSLGTSGELLTYLSKNKAKEQIETTVKRWLANELPNIDKYDVKAEDITLITYVRKRAFMHFISDYCTDTDQMLGLIADIDLYLLESETASTNTYINLLKDRIEEHAIQIKNINDQLQYREQQLLEAQEIAEMGSFEWDLIAKNTHVTEQLMKIFELDEVTNFNNFLLKVHPDDQDKVKAAIKDALHNTGLYECQYRYNGKDKEKIIWSRGVVTYENDTPVKMNGTVMDITERYHITDALQRSEERYRQAEALTHIGNYEWHIKTNELVWSDQLYRIHDLDPQTQNITYEKVGKFIHPDDLSIVRDATRKALEEQESFDYYYRIILLNGIEKILHAHGELMLDKAGKPVKIIGTVQNVTEKQTLIRRLRKSEELYKQAEQLANMGNYNWNVEKNTIEWTDQLYIIYGLEPQSETITIDRFLSFIHPDDKKEVEQSIETFFNQTSIDYTFRIITVGGVEKTIRSIAEVQFDSNGKPVNVIGTEQDVTERQKLVEKLQHSEILYKQAQAISHVGNWIYYIDSQTFEWSDEMYRIYEIPADEPLNLEKFISKLHPEDRDEVMKHITECIQNKTFYDKHHRIVLPGDTIKTIHRRGEIVVDNNGKAVKMIGTSQDVTERERFEQELKENQIFIKKIADATPSIIASYNVNTGEYVFINEGVRKLLKYDPEEILTKGVEFFTDVIHPDDVNSLVEKNNKALDDANADPLSDFIVEFTYRMKHKDGYYKWFHTYGTIFDRNESGMVEHVLNISLDVTAQVEANKKIEEQEHFIQQIADASPTILYLFDVRSESFIYINKEVYYILGYTPEELINAKDGINYLLYHTEDCNSLPERKGSSKKFTNPESMMQYECKMKAKDGEWKWMLIREIPFKIDEDGTISQVLGAALDISLRKEMEKSLLHNSYQLEQSNANLEEFAYIASHDLKEPLRKISTFGDRLFHTQINNLSDDGKVYLSKIIDASQRMQTMISDLLSISLISSDTSFQTFSLQAILEDSLQTLEHKIEQKNAVIKSDTLPDAKIVPSQFRQLFQNLISNSLKFAKENEPPVIEIKHNYISSADVANSHLTEVHRYHQLQFIDNGIGFENEYAGKIFAIFQRLHGRSEYEGTGIGLAICKKIIEHHGGGITASGEPGKGAVFTVILPEQ